MRESFDLWSQFYQQTGSDPSRFQWPSETLIRLLKGPYVPDLDTDHRGKKALEVGFGDGNNLIFLASLGLKVSGVEVREEICAVARGRFKGTALFPHLAVGTNKNLPFENDYFDILISWNVIHYEDTESAMQRAISEYSRVLKPGGHLFLSTTGPENMILEDAASLGNHRYCMGSAAGFRKGEVYFYFDDLNTITAYFGKSFRKVLVGRETVFLLTRKTDSWIVVAVK